MGAFFEGALLLWNPLLPMPCNRLQNVALEGGISRLDENFFFFAEVTRIYSFIAWDPFGKKFASDSDRGTRG